MLKITKMQHNKHLYLKTWLLGGGGGRREGGIDDFKKVEEFIIVVLTPNVFYIF